MQLRHIGVLLRVTLYRRAAELSFRGIDFCKLPREVMKDIYQDFNNIRGEMAKRLAALFAFLRPALTPSENSDPLNLALYADPAYWLYGLLSFCAKVCESKTAEVNGIPALRAKDERSTPTIEATARTLALMQTVVVSFGRNQSLGKPDLPIHHLHVYFPVQLAPKLVERMGKLKYRIPRVFVVAGYVDDTTIVGHQADSTWVEEVFKNIRKWKSAGIVMDMHNCWQVGFSNKALTEDTLHKVDEVWNHVTPIHEEGQATCSAALQRVPSYARHFVLRHGDHCIQMPQRLFRDYQPKGTHYSAA